MAAIEIPTTIGFTSKVFEPVTNQQLTPVGIGGYIQTLVRSRPIWAAEYTTPQLSGAALQDAQGFFDALDGSIGTFLAFDPRRPMPLAYSNQALTATPWGVSPTITGQDYSASTLNLANLTSGAIIARGDYISVQVNNIWYLFRTRAGATVGGGGTVTGLLVYPRPDILGLANNVFRYRRACAEMKIIGPVSVEDTVGQIGPIYKFKATQFMNRIA